MKCIGCNEHALYLAAPEQHAGGDKETWWVPVCAHHR